MGRIARVVIPGRPHHIIQRGNRRQTVFFNSNDKKFYLHLLNYHSKKENVAIWCYCLMDNHVHFVAVPEKIDSLSKAVSEIHRKYTTAINIRNNWKGRLWQGRYLSYPMDEKHAYSAVRYIERNPVRAKLVRYAENYIWSSARAHVTKSYDKVLSDFYLLKEIKDWRNYLMKRETEEEIRLIRKHEKTGRPLGSTSFILRAEKITGRRFRKKKTGRPPKKLGKQV
ncbi:MAG: transposase [Acidobacteriota bacterium]